MTRDLGYHSRVRPVVISVFLSLALAPPVLRAQINGIPPSITSIAPGRPNINIAPSVTSLGPNGFQNNHVFPVAPFAVVPNAPRFHHHHRPVYGYYPAAVPIYYGDYYGDSGQGAPGPVDDTMEEEQYRGGPTIFDRRGPGTAPRAYDDRASRNEENPPTSATRAQGSPDTSDADLTDQAGTVLVFKDGHRLEIKNYAIQGNMLYDLTAGHRRKIELAELDLAATQKENEDRGIDFELPAGVDAN